MPLQPGTDLGPYKIESPLGAGGMGEVYKAQDTRLGRTVAIKVLPAIFATDRELRERFDREARAISLLSHPNVCALYDVGRAGGIDYLVLEYLEGETLAARIRNRPLPPDAVLTTAIDIADALACAHEAGIVHRDLKPGNIMLARSGTKLLDFGLAKTRSPLATLERGLAEEQPPTITAALTVQGSILGTSQYMAPEQIERGVGDERSDIWAFGCVVFEMATGRRAFPGESAAAVMGAILATSAPAPSSLNPLMPPPLDRVVAGCLTRDPDQRWQNIRDVRRALSDIRLDRGDSLARRRSTGAGVAWGAATVLALGLLGVLAWDGSRARADDVVRFDIAPAWPSRIQLITDVHSYIAVSPDGTRVAYAAASNDGVAIWVKALDRAAPERLAGTEGGEAPFWSPDGRSLGFFAGGVLKRISLDGSPPQVLCPVSGVGYNGTWGTQGSILFSEWSSRRILRVSDTGGEATAIRTDPEPVGWPELLPDGRHYLFARLDLAAKDVRAFVGAIDSSDTTPLAGVRSRMEYAAGRLFFWREGTLFSQPFDTRALRLTGEPAAVAEHVHGFSLTGFGAFAVSPLTLVYQGGQTANRLIWMDRQGHAGSPIGPAADIVSVRLSPDTKSIAFSARDPGLGTNDVFVYDIARDTLRRLTSDRGTENSPVWAPDGRTIVYAANASGPPSLVVRDADGASDQRPLVPANAAGPQVPNSFTPDGKSLLFTASAVQTALDIFVVSLDGRATPAPLIQTPASEYQARLSPDGRWLAYVSNESGHPEVYVRAFANPRGRRQVSRAGGTAPRWRGDGRELFYLDGLEGDRLTVVDVTGDSTPELGRDRTLFTLADAPVDYDVAPDGERFLVVTAAPETKLGTLSAVMNWAAHMRH